MNEKKLIQAINDFQTFLECDLYSKFRPYKKIKGKLFCREDAFHDGEEDFCNYLDEHFKIFKEEIGLRENEERSKDE